MFGAVDGLVAVSPYSPGALGTVDCDSDSRVSVLSVADLRVTFEVIFLNILVLAGLSNFDHNPGLLGSEMDSSQATGSGPVTFRVDATTSVH